MSIYIGTPTVVTQHEFVRVNPPLFELSVNKELNLKYQVRDQINKEFPNLFRQYCIDSEMWNSLRTRMDSHVSGGIDQINRAVSSQVSNLVENKEELSSIKSQITADISRKYDSFQISLYRQNESAEIDRNTRLQKCESRLDDLRTGQIWTFLGGAILGGVIGFAAK